MDREREVVTKVAEIAVIITKMALAVELVEDEPGEMIAEHAGVERLVPGEIDQIDGRAIADAHASDEESPRIDCGIRVLCHEERNTTLHRIVKS